MIAETESESVEVVPYGMSNVIELQPGLAVSLISGADMTVSDIEAPLVSDDDYIHLNHLLQGQLNSKVKGLQINGVAGDINVGFSAGEPFYIQQSDHFCNLEIMVQPDTLYSLAGEELTGIDFGKQIEFFIRQGASCRQTKNSAHRIASLIKQPNQSPLLLHSAILEYLYWHFSALQTSPSTDFLSTREKRQLAIAKDYLLSDLSSAPTIAELAKTVGVNQCKLKRGFKALFGQSVYGCFQEERMKQAMALLKKHNVTETAVALGYSNISHFSTAFRKQYGKLPKEARRELQYDLKIISMP